MEPTKDIKKFTMYDKDQETITNASTDITIFDQRTETKNKNKIPEGCNWRKTFDADKKAFFAGKSLAIPYILIPYYKNEGPIIGEPEISEHWLLTSCDITIDGKDYDKLEYLPDYINLCKGGNAERIRGNKVRFCKK